MAAFLLSLREGLEAALVVSILFGALRRLDNSDLALRRAIWLGVAAAALLSALIAAGLTTLGAELGGRREAIFEGCALLLAAAVLTWMIFWMQSKGRALRDELTGEFQRATAQARVEGGHGLHYRLFSVAFLAVFREGVELALFLAAAAFATSAGQTLVGSILGLAAAVGLGALLFAGTLRLSLRRFFQVTGVLLVLFAAGMAARGVHELVEADLLPGVITPLWNLGPWLSDQSPFGQLLRALFGYSSDPSLAEVLVYAVYYLALTAGLWVRHARAARLAKAAVRS